MKHIEISERTLHFKQPAGTSRGVYHTRHSYYLTLTDDEKPGIKGVGECATLPDLSCDAIPEYDKILREMCRLIEQIGHIPYDMLRPYPSILFGLESAFAQFEANGSAAIFDTPFGRGEEGITINGLVWMGTFDEMYARLGSALYEDDHEKAMEAYEQSLSTAENPVDILDQLTGIYLQERKYDKAEEAARRLIDVNPGGYRGYLLYGISNAGRRRDCCGYGLHYAGYQAAYLEDVCRWRKRSCDSH